MFRFLSLLLKEFLYLWFYPVCPICANGVDSDGKCEGCNPIIEIVGRLCERCGMPLTVNLELCGACSTQKAHPIDKARSFLWFTDEAKSLVHLIKYENRFEWIGFFSQSLRTTIFPFNTEGFTLVPVPIHRKKFLQRGFNQSEILVDQLSEKLNITSALGLRKISETQPQSLLSRSERRLNLKHVFEWDVKVWVPEKVLLIDDIYTTGETLVACAKVLRKVGVKEVLAWTLFRTAES